MDPWLALERQTLVAIAVLLAASILVGWRRPSSVASLVAGAALGAFFFVWFGGVRVIVPTEYSWAIKLDWLWHFLGWHFFRHEPWHLPPGRIDGYFVPIGTTIGFTDSVPLMAFVLRPFASLLPMPMQYLGAWLLLCFTLQGFFGALLARLWSSSVVAHVAAAACFVLVPTLVNRVGHVALCSHWLLLWAIWLYFRADRDGRPAFVQIGVVSLLGGLIHPYLAAMVFALLGAIAIRVMLPIGRASAVRAVAVVSLAVGPLVLGWWASGLFTVSGIGNLASEGLRMYGLNLLAPVTPSGWSALLPERPVATDGQTFEGFQYFGVGLLALVALALAARLVSPGAPRIGTLWPLILACGVMTLFAIGPRVTLGPRIIVDLQPPGLDLAAMFRTTARFFWPATYLMIAAALAVLFARLPVRAMVPLLVSIVVLQIVDLQPGHQARRQVRQDPAFYTWSQPLVASAWHEALPHYDHIVLYPPPHCGIPPTPFEALAYLAGLHGLTINGGLVARLDDFARLVTCRRLRESIRDGLLDDRSIYVTGLDHLAEVRAAGRDRFVCGPIDEVGVCVARDSYARWRHAAVLE
jgi:hypothetical protein